MEDVQIEEDTETYRDHKGARRKPFACSLYRVHLILPVVLSFDDIRSRSALMRTSIIGQ